MVTQFFHSFKNEDGQDQVANPLTSSQVHICAHVHCVQTNSCVKMIIFIDVLGPWPRISIFSFRSHIALLW